MEITTDNRDGSDAVGYALIPRNIPIPASKLRKFKEKAGFEWKEIISCM
jgi:hypothetical protein